MNRANSITTLHWLATAFVLAIMGPNLQAQELDLSLELEDEKVGSSIVLDLVEPTDIPPVMTVVGKTSEPELVQQRFADGKVMVERWVVEAESGDIINHGSYVRYNQAGEPVLSGTYVMGKQQGEWTKQVSVDQAREISNTNMAGFTAPFTSRVRFENGSMTGEWTCKDARGNYVFVWSFSDGKRSGMSTWFNSTGQVLQKLSYTNNLADGPATVSLKKEEAAQDVVFEEGRMLRRVDRPYPAKIAGAQPKLKSQDWYLVPTPFNVETNDWNRNVVTYQPFDSSQVIRHGRSINFYENGQRESEGNYVEGKRHGSFVWWYSNGQQKTVGEYQKDQEEGNWIWWHENGMKEASGTYIAGKKVQKWSVWSSDGKLVKRTDVTDKRIAKTPEALELKPVEIR